MDIIHRVTMGEEELAQLAERMDDIVLRPVDYGAPWDLVPFEFKESDPEWPRLRPVLEEIGAVDIVWTEFTEAELLAADYLTVNAKRPSGYPQPEVTHQGWLERTYDLSAYDEQTGVGARQIRPFRFKREPRWGTKDVHELNWVMDELFVRPEVWQDVFEPFGVGCRPVVRHSSGEELETVVQLDIRETATAPLRHGGLTVDAVTASGIPKYEFWLRGYFPPFAAPQNADLFKTQDWFGSGGQAYRPIIASAELFRAIRERGLRGFRFRPLESA